jgi:hypothetical protein
MMKTPNTSQPAHKNPSRAFGAVKAHLVMPAALLLGLSIPTHAPANEPPPAMGTVMLKGSGTFDSDTVQFNESMGVPWRWHTLPESRLSLNPYDKISNGKPPVVDGHLALHASYFVGRSFINLMNVMCFDIENLKDQPGDGTKAITAADVIKGNVDGAGKKQDPQGGDAVKFSRAWYPYKLVMSSEEKATGRRIEVTDFMSDVNTVVRQCVITSAEGGTPDLPSIGGKVKGEARIVDDVELRVQLDGVCYVLMVSSPKEGPLKLTLEGNTWKAQAPSEIASGGAITAVVGFATADEGENAARERARKALDTPVERSLQTVKNFWDRELSQVPAPANFGLQLIRPAGITPEQHRVWYYAAWNYVLAQIMPALPETGYKHFIFAEGKSSSWAEGHPKSAPQTAWTAFMVAGLLADKKPDIAWDAYLGIMSKVDGEGVLDGECLPSRKAQAAWILYDITGDKEKLRSVYPALKRYLIWREKNPRWIWSTADIPDEKDSDFVVSHLIDVEYTMRICKALGMDDEIGFWQTMTKRALENYRTWFFPKDGDPMNYYFTESKTHSFKHRTVQEPLYILTGLAFKGMPEDLADRLLAFYDKFHAPEKDICGLPHMKYGESSFIAYGLLDRGRVKQANEFMEAMIRDTIKLGDFGEAHRVINGVNTLEGVTPSLFLALQVIDLTLMRNGIRIDQGRIQPVPAK